MQASVLDPLKYSMDSTRSSIETPPSLQKFGVRMEDVLEAVRRRVPAFRETALSDLICKPLTGGMSNLMFVIEVPSGRSGAWNPLSPPLLAGDSEEGLPSTPLTPTASASEDVTRVVARILSPQLDAVIDRAREHQIVSYLSTTGIGPRLYGTAAIHPHKDLCSPSSAAPLLLRVEEFIEGRTLGISDLRYDLEIAGSMARKVARLHTKRPHLRDDTSTEGNLSSSLLTSTAPSPLAGAAHLEPSLRQQLERYIAIVSGLVVGARAELSSHESLFAVATGCEWKDEVAWLCKLMESRGGPIVLAHCDLQEGNFILSASNRRLYLIDYEYSGYNYRGYDLGNMFCEHIFDYSLSHSPGYTFERSAYPSLAWQQTFARNYLEQYKQSSARAAHPTLVTQESSDVLVDLDTAALLSEESAGHASGSDGGDDAEAALWALTSCSREALDMLSDTAGYPDMRETLRQARLGMLCSHLYWSLWSVVMAAGKLGIVAPTPVPTSDMERKSADTGDTDDGAHRTNTAAKRDNSDGVGGSGAIKPAMSPASKTAGVASGHSTFDYGHYGGTRLQEYRRLKAQLQRDCPKWFT